MALRSPNLKYVSHGLEAPRGVEPSLSARNITPSPTPVDSSLGSVFEHLLYATTGSALDVWTMRARLGRQTREPQPALLEQTLIKSLASRLHNLPFTTEMGGDVAGIFGQGNLRVQGISRLMGGILPFSEEQPGVSLILALAKNSGDVISAIKPLMDTDHMLTYLAPPKIGGIDLKKPHKENLQEICDRLRVHPSRLTQVTLNYTEVGKERSQNLRRKAAELGVDVVSVDRGDSPLLEMMSVLGSQHAADRHFFAIGVIPSTDTIVAAALAHLQGGVVAARPFKGGALKIPRPENLTTKDFVQAQREHTIVAAVFMSPHMAIFDQDQPGIKRDGERYKVPAMVVNSQGIKFEKLTV